MRVDRHGIASTTSSRTSTTASGNMIAAKPSRRKSCEHPSCPKQPAFSYNGSGVRFCAQHRLKGMVNVRNRRCEGINCTKEPYFGERGGKARFCASHKPDEEMVDVRHRRCEFVSCHKQPNYGYEGQRACFCSTHKLPTMVDVKHRRCAEAGCRGYSSFAFPGSKEKFCAAHRLEGMVPSGRGRGAAAAAASVSASVSASTSPAIINTASSATNRPPISTTSGLESSKTTRISWENGGSVSVEARKESAPGSGAVRSTKNGSRPTRSVSGIDNECGEEGRKEGSAMVWHKHRGSIGSQYGHRQGEVAEDSRAPPSMKEASRVNEDGYFRRRSRGISEHDMDVNTAVMRRQSNSADFVPLASTTDSCSYAAHDRGSLHPRIPGMSAPADSSPSRMMRSAMKQEQQQRQESSDNVIRPHRITSPSRMDSGRGPASWPSWTAPRAYGSGGVGGHWPRAPLLRDVNQISFSKPRDDVGGARRVESGEGDGGSSSDDTRGGYPAPRFASGGGAGGGAAAQMGCFAAGGPSRDNGIAFKKSPVSRRIGDSHSGGSVPTWAESVLVSRQLPSIGGPAVSQDTTSITSASHNSHGRDDLPKLDAVLAEVSSYQWSAFVPRRKKSVGPAWPRPDVAREPGSRARNHVDRGSSSSGGNSCMHDGVGGGRGGAFVLKPPALATSRVFTLTGPQRRLVKYDQGAGPLGPTLETLEPRWRASLAPLLHAQRSG